MSESLALPAKDALFGRGDADDPRQGFASQGNDQFLPASAVQSLNFRVKQDNLDGIWLFKKNFSSRIVKV